MLHTGPRRTMAGGGRTRSSSSSGDPFWSSVVLLLGNDNPANGTATFLDQSASAKTIGKSGSPVYSTTSPPTGMTSSIRLARATSDFLTGADSADYSFAAGDLTLEAYYNPDNTDGGAIVDFNGGAGSFSPADLAYSTSFGTSQRLQSWISVSGASWDAGPGNSSANLTTAAWQHVAMTRSGTTWNMWLAGASVYSATIAGSLFDPTGGLRVGNFQGQFLTGYLASLRVTKGVARYTGAFTPPTLPLPTSA